uniref:Uncharacterized protein n=1 Tax=Cladosiphon okamuranus TaxID=309737 RepID=A0A3G5FPN4_9PHAE|nr:hypothetical protein Cloka_032 [Cladosiphon okamuranus]AYW52601.1 hypothetical protein Cloka_032 [Cladosiphon okamuranus]
MVIKKPSKDDLVHFSYSCVVSKKYHQYDLWFGSIDEYKDIKYCKRYIEKYLYFWIHFSLLEGFSLNFVRLLCNSPYFIKFLKSGFFKYFDYHFLLSFHNNYFIFDLKDKQRLKTFVNLYFQNNLKKRFENDLFLVIIKALNELFSKDLGKALKNTHRYQEQIILNNKLLFNKLNKKKKKVLENRLLYFIHLIQVGYYKVSLGDFIGCNYSENPYSSLLKSRGFGTTKTSRFNLNYAHLNKKRVEKIFIGFPQKSLHLSNKNVQYLMASVEDASSSNTQYKSIGLYKNNKLCSEGISVQKSSFLTTTTFKDYKIFLKSFNTCYVKP